jgi:hypothetical protein
MRARRSPAAVGLIWAWRAALAILVAIPAGTVVRDAVAGMPGGERALAEPGAHALLVFLTRQPLGIDAIAALAGLVLILGAVGGIVPTACAMTAIARSSTGKSTPWSPRVVATAASRVPALARLAVLVIAAQAALAGGGWLSARVAIALTSAPLGEAASQALGGAVATIFVVPALALTVPHDLARASIVRSRTGAVQALAAATRECRSAPGRVAWAWTWRACAGLASVVVSGAIALRIGLTVEGSWVLGLAVLHQVTMGIRAGLRASWLAWTLRSVDS